MSDYNPLTIIYFVAWLFVFLHYWRKHKTFGAYSVIVLSYVIYALISIFCEQMFPSEHKNITFIPFAYLFVLLIVALQPVKQFDNAEISCLIGIKKNIIYAIFTLFVISTFIVLPSTLSHLKEGFTILFMSDDGARQLYDEMHANQTSHSFINGGVVGICTIVRYLLFEISVFLFFYYLTWTKQNKKLIIVLLLSFSIDILISLSNGSRTGSTMSVFTLLITFLIFKKFINGKVRNIARAIGLSLGGLFIFLTAIVTIGRTLNRDGGATEGVVEYLGQGNLYFNEYAFNSSELRNGDRTCNVFKRLLGFNGTPDSITKVRSKHSKMQLNDANFSTFIGDFCLDFGPFITFFIIVIFTIFFMNITRIRNNVIHLEQLLIVQLVANICMHGGMYLFNYSFSGNYILLMYFIMFFVIRNNRRYSLVLQ